MPRTFPTLDAFYYLEHFREMLEFVDVHCGELLGDGEKEYMDRFRGGSRDAQGLHVRMSNRRGIAFRPEKFSYAEIADVNRAVQELMAVGFLDVPQESHYADVLTAMTKAELVQALGECGVESVASLAKKDLIRHGMESVSFDRLIVSGSVPEMVVQREGDTLEFIQFLYFGHRRSGMQMFALRDLGIVKTRDEASEYKARFSDADTARAAFFYSRLRDRIDGCELVGLEALAAQCGDWPRGDDETDRRFHRTIAKLGMGLERGGSVDLASEVYALSDVHPARERRCRILMSQGDREAAAVLLDEIIVDPSSDDELLFAEDFRARKFGGEKRSRLTEMLRAAPVIKSDEAFRDSAENAAMEHYRGLGMEAYRTENQLWSMLFHALFWDEIFDGEGGVTPNPFDPRPTQWIDGSFVTRQGEAIEQKLAHVLDGKAMAVVDAAMGKVLASDYGRLLGMGDDGVAVKRFLELASPSAVVEILRRMLDQPVANRSGFPDLMLVDDGVVRFVEVKGEGDQLRRNQLAQLVAMENAGFDVGVVRVEWCVNPMQEYVVVDIETTGGRAEHHRITEVAGVKMRGGEVVDKFQTLVNPERRIPRMITSLTGISDEMVADAPVFAEVAKSFCDFVGGAVFVAHNAKFDYGFLRQEFRRMGEEFRSPTLCTVVAMRKFFPGLESYKLSRLCVEFGISLDDHHRALCDAEATAELLKLINGKRMGE